MREMTCWQKDEPRALEFIKLPLRHGLQFTYQQIYWCLVIVFFIAMVTVKQTKRTETQKRRK